MNTTNSPTDNLPLAIATILMTMLIMSLGDALVKGLGMSGEASLGLWQLFALRSALCLPVFLIIGAMMGFARVLRPKALGWVLTRSTLLIVVWVCYYAALPHMPLSAAAAALYTLPLFIVGFSALWTQDKVGPIQGLAALLGFIGVGLVLRPGGEAFTWYALLPILAAIAFAAAMVLARLHCNREHPLALAFNLHLVFVVSGCLGLAALSIFPSINGTTFLSTGWQTLTANQWQLMGLLAVSILVVSVGTAFAYQKAPGAIIGTFEFAYVGFATLWGVLFFAEQPDTLALAGLGLIILAGILTVRR